MGNLQLEPRKFLAPEYIFGIDTRKMATSYCRKLGGNRVLVVTDPGVMNTRWYPELIEDLEASKIDFIVYSNVSPNPRDYEIMEGARIYSENKCSLILAMGGGSVLDCAKGIGIVSSNFKEIHAFEGVDMIEHPIPPLICIPTTGGTAADVSQFAIINNTSEKYKMAIISKALVPDISLVDPLVLTTMDSYLTACVGMDALSHAFEAFVSNANSPFTDMYALESIRLINANLIESTKNPMEMQYRGNMMLASLYAGLAFSNASLGCVHSLSHSLGGYLDLPHGESNAIMLPHVVNYNFNASSDRYTHIANELGIKTPGLTSSEVKNALVDYLFDMQKALNIHQDLKSWGVKSDITPTLAGKAINDPCNATNPRVPSRDDLISLYNEAT